MTSPHSDDLMPPCPGHEHWNPTLSANPYETDLDRNPANYQPLTPLAHLERAALIHPITSRSFMAPADDLSHVPRALEAARQRADRSRNRQGRHRFGDAVEHTRHAGAHHGVPMTGAVLHSINTRLDAQAIAFQLDHADCKVLIVDREFSAVMAEALALARSSRW
jgi:fatty-acyl-CoA synthase